MDYTGDMQPGNIPLGLALGMAMNENAIDHYGKLTEYEKEQVLAKSRNVKSKEEMQQLIQKLGDGDTMIQKLDLEKELRC